MFRRYAIRHADDSAATAARAAPAQGAADVRCRAERR